MSCQGKSGGFGKWPDIYSDVLHSYMGICGLSLASYPNIAPLHPALDISLESSKRIKETIFWQ